MTVRGRIPIALLVLVMGAIGACEGGGPTTGGLKQTVSFEADTRAIANPERGWFFQFTPPCCDNPDKGVIHGAHPPISSDLLHTLRALPERVTLYTDVVKIQQWTSDIPRERLDQIQADLDTAREAGMKVILRFAYNWSLTTPDPAQAQIASHLEQLAPILERNADVIFAVQSGLFGSAGESATSENYIDNTKATGGAGADGGGLRLNAAGLELYQQLYSILPDGMWMLMRYPRYKFQMLGWDQGLTYPVDQAKPVTAGTAFDGSPASRLGYYDQNFAGDRYHYGFFYLWPNLERAFAITDTRYVLISGEVPGMTNFVVRNGASEMKTFHFTAFHAVGSNVLGEPTQGSHVWDAWKSSGQYDEMTRSLGYRLRLISATLPRAISAGERFTMQMEMANDGWAGVMNPRGVQVVLREASSGQRFTMDVDNGYGNQRWFPGPGETKALSISEPLPEDIPSGTYDVLLNLPDVHPSISSRPAYSIHLANLHVWEASTGYNDLGASIQIFG